jgi:hypothetical protein
MDIHLAADGMDIDPALGGVVFLLHLFLSTKLRSSCSFVGLFAASRPKKMRIVERPSGVVNKARFFETLEGGGGFSEEAKKPKAEGMIF